METKLADKNIKDERRTKRRSEGYKETVSTVVEKRGFGAKEWVWSMVAARFVWRQV